MKTLELIRHFDCEFGMFGKQGDLYTLERSWHQNKPNISCIPAGTYPLKRTIFHKGGYETFEIVNVPGRTEIKFHIANTIDELEGCIALGLGIGCVGNNTGLHWAVTSSKQAFELFMRRMDGAEEGLIIIRNATDILY